MTGKTKRSVLRFEDVCDLAAVETYGDWLRLARSWGCAHPRRSLVIWGARIRPVRFPAVHQVEWLDRHSTEVYLAGKTGRVSPKWRGLRPGRATMQGYMCWHKTFLGEIGDLDVGDLHAG